MKQAEDNATIDMYGEVKVVTPAADKFEFWVETTSGERTEWRGLSKQQARNMHTWTDKFLPHNVARYGWGVMS